MKSKLLVIGIISMLIVFASCKKDIDHPRTGPSSISELAVPADFDWKTTQDVLAAFTMDAFKNYQMKSRIAIYDRDPVQGGKVIKTGAISPQEAFSVSMRIPSYLTEVYVELTSGLGVRQTEVVPINNGTVAFHFSELKTDGFGSGFFKSGGEVGPDCNTGCDVTVTQTSGTITVNQGKTYCIAGTFNGDVVFQTWAGGGTLRVCGSATLNNVTLGTSSYIVVTQSGNCVINGITMWSNSAGIKVYQNAACTVNGNLMTSGTLENQGMLNVTGQLTVQQIVQPFLNTGSVTVGGALETNGSVTINNQGTINVNGSYFHLNNQANCQNAGVVNVNNGTFQANSGSSLTNDNELYVSGTFKINAGSNVINNCKFICTGLLEVNASGFLTNSGYLKGAQRVKLTSGSSTVLTDGSMISSAVVEMYANVSGTGSLNSIKATSEFIITSPYTVGGQIEVVTNNLNILSQTPPAQHFINGATVVDTNSVSNYIPINSCNPEGMGRNPVTDTDMDGVPDDIDEFPNDPERAFQSYFPSEDTYASVVFEDLWPSKGDYDFNDLVLAVYGTEITNGDNELVDININFVVRAAGASLQNGFGWQFETITPQMITSVTGMSLTQNYVTLNPNGTEAGQNQAVIIAADNIEDLIHRSGGSMFNTVENGFTGYSDTLDLHIYCNPPIDRNLVGPDAYNVFLIVDQTRSHEVHPVNNRPTSLVNTNLFGTFDDASVPGSGLYYQTSTNLPWALLILDSFDYPIEKAEIIQAYYHFAEWAESGGTDFQDWYKNKPGYRNNSKIYGAD